MIKVKKDKILLLKNSTNNNTASVKFLSERYTQQSPMQGIGLNTNK
jgi:hypothetical protein